MKRDIYQEVTNTILKQMESCGGDIAPLNLGAMDESELIAFTRDCGNEVRPIAFARKLFPDRPTGYINTTLDLRNYAWYTITAMQFRRRGDIPLALEYEEMRDRIYRELPIWARW